MREYKFSQIEAKWQRYWLEQKSFAAQEDATKPRCYVLDMFPYPSGAGLHVGHPLGYVASDVYAHYKRLRGFNVLHPIGFDAFGLPAEQYALQTGTHPEQSTQKNIQTYIEQLQALGLSYDWSRLLNTSSPDYYRWTQWIFLRLFESFFDPHIQGARPIKELLEIFAREGNRNYATAQSSEKIFSASEWQGYSEGQRAEILMEYRLAYLAYTEVNWCEALGTVLANDEVINGRSYRGGHPVVKRKMRQWNLRISAYADRLLKGLEDVDYSQAMKDMQSNWIGKSEGAIIKFPLADTKAYLEVFSSRAETIFGVDFLVLAPEHPLVASLTRAENRVAVEDYINACKQRSELERIAESKHITGVNLGSFALHPISAKPVPIWVADYVLGHYGTGAVMGVADGDARDANFAHTMQLAWTRIWDADKRLINSDFLNGLTAQEASVRIHAYLEAENLGYSCTKFKIRDACWSRQRYWGEPFPVRYDENNMPQSLTEEELPLSLPPTQNFQPSQDGKGPLGTIATWILQGYDTDTMPTHAGAAWYFLRYADPENSQSFASLEKLKFWGAVDIYVGGAEHAVSHLLYARFFTKVLYDLGLVPFQEPFQKLINQGKILGISSLVYREQGTNRYISQGLLTNYATDELYVMSDWVQDGILDLEKFKTANPEAEFVLEEGRYYCGQRTEKMSKSKLNVINPDAIIRSHGADTLRLYELFLGPLEQNKPWNTHGIEGVHRFLHKLWRLVFPTDTRQIIQEIRAEAEELGILHTCIRKVTQDIERFSFNTAISALMICVNELSARSSISLGTMAELLKLLFPYAPHLSSELWEYLYPEAAPIFQQSWPEFLPEYLHKPSQKYPISINGKTRSQLELPNDISEAELPAILANAPELQKWLQGREIKKIIFVRGRIVNLIV